MKKILITGGSGFVGKNTYEYLKRNENYEVYAPDSSELDCINEAAVKDYLEKNKFDIILNFAVYGDGIDKKKDGSKILQYNLMMYQNFAKYYDLYEKMLYLGSGAEYDKRFPICQVNEEEVGKSVPVDQYGLMKYTVGQLIEYSSNIYNLRLFGIYGKYEYWPVKFISNICCKAMYDLPLTIRQNTFFDYLWIEDFLQILNAFINCPKPQYHTYNVVSGTRIDLLTLCQYVKAASGKDLKVIVCKEGLANEYTASNKRLKQEFSDLKITPNKTAVEKLYQWYLSQKSNIDLYHLIY